MQSKDRQLPIDIGSVSIGIDKGKFLRLRWTIGGKQEALSYGSYTQEHLDAAITTAHILNRDLVCDNYDWSKAKYQPPWKKVAPIRNNTVISQPKEITLLEIWEQYQNDTGDRIQNATKKTHWKTIDKALSTVSKPALLISNPALFFTEWKVFHSVGTIKSCYIVLNAAINHFVDLGKLSENTHKKVAKRMLPQSKNTKGQTRNAYSFNELTIILEAFKSNRYSKKKDRFGHACYAPLVEFRMLTGCRPEEAFALTWDDIKHGKNGRVDIVFNKAFTYGELKNETKIGVTRIFPCNSQLLTLLDSIPKNHPAIFFVPRIALD